MPAPIPASARTIHFRVLGGIPLASALNWCRSHIQHFHCSQFSVTYQTAQLPNTKFFKSFPRGKIILRLGIERQHLIPQSIQSAQHNSVWQLFTSTSCNWKQHGAQARFSYHHEIGSSCANDLSDSNCCVLDLKFERHSAESCSNAYANPTPALRT